MDKILLPQAFEQKKAFNAQSATTKYDNQTSSQTVLGGQGRIGDATAETAHQGFQDPNVAQALQQIEQVTVPINGLAFTLEDTNPEGVQATERLTIELTRNVIQTKGVINLYGQQIVLEMGENVATVSQKITDVLGRLVDRNVVIHRVTRPSGQNNMIDITYIDRLNHRVVEFDDQVLGIRIRGEVIVQPLVGYGVWDKVGTNDTLLPGKNISIWRRLS